jgi:hypothetical protein
MEKGAVDPSAIGPTTSSSVSSDTVVCCASLVEPSLFASIYLAPLDDMAASYQDERVGTTVQDALAARLPHDP